MTDDQLDELLQQQKAVIEKLAKGKEKDFWDKVSTFSTFLASVVIAAVGVYFTNAYKAQDVKVAEAQVIEKLVTDLSGNNENAKKGALLTAASLSNKDLAARLGALYASPGTVDALEVLYKDARGDSKLALRESLIEAYFNRGVEDNDKKNYFQVVEDYNKIFNLKTPAELTQKSGGYFLADCYLNRGIGYGGTGKYDLAILDFKKSLSVIPDYGPAYWNLGYACASRTDSAKSLDEALRYYDMAIKYGAQPRVYVDRGNAYFDKGEIDLAIADYDTFISGSGDYDAYRQRATAFEKKGDVERARSDLMSARSLTKDSGLQKQVDDELKSLAPQESKGAANPHR